MSVIVLGGGVKDGSKVVVIFFASSSETAGGAPCFTLAWQPARSSVIPMATKGMIRRHSGPLMLPEPSGPNFSISILLCSCLIKIKRPPRAKLRPRRHLDVWCAFDCTCGGPGDMIIPVSFGLPQGALRSLDPYAFIYTYIHVGLRRMHWSGFGYTQRLYPC